MILKIKCHSADEYKVMKPPIVGFTGRGWQVRGRGDRGHLLGHDLGVPDATRAACVLAGWAALARSEGASAQSE